MIKANATLVKIFHAAMVEERSTIAQGARGEHPELVGLRAVFESPEFKRQLSELFTVDTEVFFKE